MNTNNQSSSSGVPLLGAGRGPATLEITQSLKDALTRYFASAHGIPYLDFRTIPSRDDWWELYRAGYPRGDSQLLPPRRLEMTVFPGDDFDTGRLQPQDLRRLRAIGRAHEFEYRQTRHRIWFMECQSPAEILGQEMAVAWRDKAPCRRRPNPIVFLEATRIFLRFLKWHGTIDRTEMDRAKKIIRRLVSSCHPYLVREQYVALVKQYLTMMPSDM